MIKSFARRLSSYVTRDYVENSLQKILNDGKYYGFQDGKFTSTRPRTIIIEFSSPNIAKRFHVGHFRSTIVGQALSNIMEMAGNKVIRLNYLGDWGMQFAILAVGFEKHGDQDMLRKNPLQHLYATYVKANGDMQNNPTLKQKAQDAFYDMEQGEPKLLEFWKLCSSASLAAFDKLYKNMGVSFDNFESESMYLDPVKNVLADLRNRGLLVSSDNKTVGMDLSNSTWFKNRRGQEPSFGVLARSNGTSLYLSRDVAAAVSRHQKYSFDKMYYVTDKSQELHFLQLFSVLELMGKAWAKPEADALQHLQFGRVQGMRTRKGEVVFFEDICEEACELAREERLEHATRKRDIVDEDAMLRTLGMSGLICNDLRSKLLKDYRFRWDVALQTKGYTGIFLQYTHSRLQSLRRMCGVELAFDVDCSDLLNDESAIALLRHMVSYSGVAWKAYEELEPCHIIQYMFQLSHLVAQALKYLPVKGQELSVAQARLLLFYCCQQLLHNCMVTVGMQPLDKM